MRPPLFAGWPLASDRQNASVAPCLRPNSIPKLSGTNVGSWYAVPLRIKPERGQVSENSANAPSKQSCDVLHDDVAGSNLANNSGVLSPQTATVAVNSGAFSCQANVLARESAADDIDVNVPCCGVGGNALGSEAPDIFVARDGWPVLSEDLLAEWVDLAERDGSHPGSFEAKREAANSREEIKDIHFHFLPPLRTAEARGVASRFNRVQSRL
jgi:hypothetical protein